MLEELLMALGLVLITVALWPTVGRLALLGPGLTLIWIALPQRARFIHRSAEPDSPSQRKR